MATLPQQRSHNVVTLQAINNGISPLSVCHRVHCGLKQMQTHAVRRLARLDIQTGGLGFITTIADWAPSHYPTAAGAFKRSK